MSKIHMYYRPSYIPRLFYPEFLVKIRKELEDSNYTESKTFDNLMSNDFRSDKVNSSMNVLGRIIQELSVLYDVEYFKFIKRKYDELFKDGNVLDYSIKSLEDMYNFVESCEMIKDEVSEEKYLEIEKNAQDYSYRFAQGYLYNPSYGIELTIDSQPGVRYDLLFTDKDGNEIVIDGKLIVDKEIYGDRVLDEDAWNAIQFCLDLLQLHSYGEEDKLNFAKYIAIMKLSNYVNISLIEKKFSFGKLSFGDKIKRKK